MKHLLLLHGAAGSKEQLIPLVNRLKENFHVHSINFSGHGGKASAQPFSVQAFAEEVLDWMKAQGLQTVSVFGYSMGGYVAAYLAKIHPGKIESIITLGTKWQWNEAIAAKETGLLNPQVIEQKVPKFAEALARLHYPADWKTVLQKTADMLNEMGANNPLKQEDFKAITAKVLLLLGDRDKMVSVDETKEVFKALPSAQLAVLPGTPHQIEAVEPDLLAFLVKRFLA